MLIKVFLGKYLHIWFFFFNQYCFWQS